jgi:hypothetical protein
MNQECAERNLHLQHSLAGKINEKIKWGNLCWLRKNKKQMLIFGHLAKLMPFCPLGECAKLRKHCPVSAY